MAQEKNVYFESTADGVRVSVQPPSPAPTRFEYLYYTEPQTNKFTTVAEEKARLLEMFDIGNPAEYEMVIIKDTEIVKEMEDDRKTYDYSGYLCSNEHVLKLRQKAAGQAP